MLKKLYYTTLGGIHKNRKIDMYLRGLCSLLVPGCLQRLCAARTLARYDHLPEEQRKQVDWRVDYYCALSDVKVNSQSWPTLADNHLRTDCTKDYPTDIARRKGRLAGPVSYFFDTIEYTRCFNQSLHWMVAGGDVSTQQPVPTITKSRPLLDLSSNGTSNNVLMKLNRIRHFIFFKDPVAWRDKQSKVIFRGVVKDKPRRQQFLDMWQQHPLCDLKDMGGMTIYDHLAYRYIMTLEGNDVASNLKWVMSSNSIAVMPRPTCETWYMEGRLVPDYHYICIADDYHDLEEKITYYEAHPDEAEAIVEHAHEWARQFRDSRMERMISLRVMQKYLENVNS